jgi:hypothetical protein
MRRKAHPGATGNLSDSTVGIAITPEPDGDAPWFTTLAGTLDQAALHGLLRRLYALGLPLLSVSRVEAEEQGSDPKGVTTSDGLAGWWKLLKRAASGSSTQPTIL